MYIIKIQKLFLSLHLLDYLQHTIGLALTIFIFLIEIKTKLNLHLKMFKFQLKYK